MKLETSVYKRIAFTSGLLIASIYLCSCGKEIKAENDKLHQEVQTLSKQNGDLEIDLEKAKLRIEAEQNTVENLKTQVSELTAKVHRLEDVEDTLRNQLTDRETALSEMNTQLNQTRSDFAAFRNAQNAAKKEQLEQERLNQKGELFGNVAYYFNDNYGFKPDSGSNVYIWKQDQYPDFDSEALSAFLYKKREFTKEQQDELLTTVLTIQFEKNTIKATADGNGSFQRKLSPGKYFVLVRSAHRKNLNPLEVVGKLSLHTLEITPGGQSNIDAKFHVY